MANSSATLGTTSQLILDVLYQNYITDEDFISDVHIRYVIASYYSTLLMQDYQSSKKENFGENGFIYPSFASELIRTTEPLDVKKDGDFSYVETVQVMSFPYDSYGFGVQSVRCLKNTVNNEFNRTTSKMKNKFNVIPFSDIVWWWCEANRIYMYSASKIPSKVIANIIPAMNYLDEGFVIPDTLQTQIINGVLDFFKRGAANSVIDMSDNSNPNKVLQSEIDSATLKPRA